MILWEYPPHISLEFNFVEIWEKLLTNACGGGIIYKLSGGTPRKESAAGPWKLNKTETCGTLNVGLETHDNQFQIYK